MELLAAFVVASAAIVMAISVRSLTSSSWPRRPPPLPSEPTFDDLPHRYRVLAGRKRVFYDGPDRQAAKIVRADLREVWKVDARLEVDGVDRG
jgi:hypothetical protein